MTGLLLRKFVRNYENTGDPAVRDAVGRLSGIVGILCNVLLFAAKFLAGTLTGSVAITADAINNLSDASSSVVTLLGFKLASKPADEKHPYGYARIEYMAGLIVAGIILIIGYSLAQTSIEKIRHPETIEFSALSIAILVASILMKLWMSRFNTILGNHIHSTTLLATAADSRNDVISTGTVLCACILAKSTGIIADGWMGLDIGPKSVALFSEAVKSAKTVVGNGPMGCFEFAPLSKGTYGVCDAVATVKANGGISIIGGGDSVSAVKKSGKAAEMSHVSTGGGASLEFLEGKVLPGVAALDEK